MHTQGKSVGGSGAKYQQAGPSHILRAGARIHGVMAGALHLVGLGLTCVWRGGGGGSSGGRGLHTRPHRPPGPSSKAVAVAGGGSNSGGSGSTQKPPLRFPSAHVGPQGRS